jgi:hypothetical protein
MAVKHDRKLHHRDTKKKPGDGFGNELIGGGSLSPILCASYVVHCADDQLGLMV